MEGEKFLPLKSYWLTFSSVLWIKYMLPKACGDKEMKANSLTRS